MPSILRLLRLIRRSVRGPQHAPPSPPPSSLSSLRTTFPSHSLPFRSFCPNLPPSPVPSLSFLEAHQRLTKYLPRSSPTLLKKVVTARRFKRYCFTPREKREKSARRSWLETLLYQFQTVAGRDRTSCWPSLSFYIMFVFFADRLERIEDAREIFRIASNYKKRRNYTCIYRICNIFIRVHTHKVKYSDLLFSFVLSRSLTRYFSKYENSVWLLVN